MREEEAKKQELIEQLKKQGFNFKTGPDKFDWDQALKGPKDKKGDKKNDKKGEKKEDKKGDKKGDKKNEKKADKKETEKKVDAEL